MHSSQLQTFLLLFTRLWMTSYSEVTGQEQVDCDDPELDDLFLIEGESLWFTPQQSNQNSSFTWFWKMSQDIIQLSSEETEPVHAHGDTLCVLNITRERSGCFLAREVKATGDLTKHYVRVNVVPEDSPKRVYTVEESDTNIFIFCPEHALHPCNRLNGTLSWYKDGMLLPEQHWDPLLVSDATAKDQGRYDCVCTWIHQNHLYRSVAPRQLQIIEQRVYLPVRILAPIEKQQLADPGVSLLLNCTVLCGINLPSSQCVATWNAKNSDLQSEGYNQTRHVEKNASKKTIVTQTLTIKSVSALHFTEEYECLGERHPGDSESIIVHLQPRESLVSLVTAGTCVFVLFVLISVMVKCFVIDLVLLSRRLFPFRLGDTGVKVFDAYVVYQMPSHEKPIEELLCRFVSQELPHILENMCGYKLFIHGRDNLPGEDLVELVEERMRKSRRLMVILTPCAASGVTETYEQPEGYDWQVGLHQALVLRDLSVILIQLGDTGPRGYSHLPPALQHLIQKSAPIRWTPGPCTAQVHSRFWKRVRYLMPATPVRTYPLSTI